MSLATDLVKVTAMKQKVKDKIKRYPSVSREQSKRNLAHILIKDHNLVWTSSHGVVVKLDEETYQVGLPEGLQYKFTDTHRVPTYEEIACSWVAMFFPELD